MGVGFPSHHGSGGLTLGSQAQQQSPFTVQAILLALLPLFLGIWPVMALMDVAPGLYYINDFVNQETMSEHLLGKFFLSPPLCLLLWLTDFTSRNISLFRQRGPEPIFALDTPLAIPTVPSSTPIMPSLFCDYHNVPDLSRRPHLHYDVCFLTDLLPFCV